MSEEEKESAMQDLTKALKTLNDTVSSYTSVSKTAASALDEIKILTIPLISGTDIINEDVMLDLFVLEEFIKLSDIIVLELSRAHKDTLRLVAESCKE